MKALIKQLVASIGCTTHYSGKDKIMYIRGKNISKVGRLLSAAIRTKQLPFALVIGNQ